MEGRGSMSKRSVIVRFSLIGLLIALGGILTFASFNIPLFRNGTVQWTGFLGAVESRMGIDLQGGVLAVFDVTPNPDAPSGGNFNSQVDATVLRLQNTLSDRGFVEATVTRQTSGGTTQIRIEVPGIGDAEELMDIIGSPAELDMRMVNDVANTDSIRIIGARDVNRVSVVGAGLNEFGVRVHFNNQGGDRFRSMVQDIGAGNSMYIFIDGQLFSAVNISDTSVGQDNTATITGGAGNAFSQSQARDFAMRIEGGLFQVVLEQNQLGIIPPTLGEGALMAGIIAFIVGLVFIFLLMWFLYGHFGLLSNLSMIIYSIMFIAALAVVGSVQLTLPGVAGIILAMAMAVDANIIIFERIKDEFKMGKRLSSAVEAGFKKSFWTIFDANITTILGGIILFFVGTGPIQGFAITLLLGVVVSMFCSLIVTRGLVRMYMVLNPNNAKKVRMSQVATLDESPTVSVKKIRSLNLK